METLQQGLQRPEILDDFSPAPVNEPQHSGCARLKPKRVQTSALDDLAMQEEVERRRRAQRQLEIDEHSAQDDPRAARAFAVAMAVIVGTIVLIAWL